MTYGPEERVWDGETCFHCGKDLKRESSSIDEHYFCSDYCLGAYLIEKHEDEIKWIDFITEEALKDRWREDSKMGD
jgi:hypothetical protein